MIKIYFQLIDNYVQGWHIVTPEYPAMFQNTAELETEEQLQHFNDNYFAYTMRNGELFFDEARAAEYPLQQKQKADREKQIADLKAQLTATDYKAIKYAEGLISEADYAPVKAERQRLRDEINALDNPEPPKSLFIY